MATEQARDPEELTVLRARVADLEREQHERTARANAALAAAQDKSYWLDRWHVDLNELMRKPGASEARAAFRGARQVYRALHRAREHVRSIPLRTTAARRTLDEDRQSANTLGSGQFTRDLGPEPLAATAVTDLLYERLTQEDLDEITSRLATAELSLWGTSDEVERRRLALAFAAHFELAGALERTGLASAMPGQEVHAMGRGAAAAGGSAYYADLVQDALASSGFAIEAGRSGLDFGCSSGRVVRVLQAAYPEVDWRGCDPIPDAIEWARDNLTGIEFVRSPQQPPLPYGDGELDFVFAISIWSHFAEEAALAWLAEMRRIIRSGGRLVMTTHGLHTILHTHIAGVRSSEQLAEIAEALRRRGFWYAAEFGEAGDHGVVDPTWGTAFLTPEWLLTRATPGWRVGLFRPGRVEDNQDLYVLERV